MQPGLRLSATPMHGPIAASPTGCVPVLSVPSPEDLPATPWRPIGLACGRFGANHRSSPWSLQPLRPGPPPTVLPVDPNAGGPRLDGDVLFACLFCLLAPRFMG